jgi:hypothetical protein
MAIAHRLTHLGKPGGAAFASGKRYTITFHVKLCVSVSTSKMGRVLHAVGARLDESEEPHEPYRLSTVEAALSTPNDFVERISK